MSAKRSGIDFGTGRLSALGAGTDRAAALTVDDGQPSAEMLGGFVGRLAVERHQGRRASGDTNDLSAPLTGGDARHLDPVRAPIDDLFKPVNVHVAPPPRCGQISTVETVSRLSQRSPWDLAQGRPPTQQSRPDVRGVTSPVP